MTERTPSWQIEFYEREEDGCPVQDFLNALDKPARAKVLALVRLLAEQGPTLPFPYSSPVRGKIRELRTQHGRENLRVLYFGSSTREWVLLHGFTKRNDADIRARHKDRGGQNDRVSRATEGDRTMKKPTSWDLYFQKQLGDPEMRGLIDEELESLRVGTQIARWRQKKGLSQAELAARAGMSAPNISRIENSPAQNMTLETLVKIARALGRGVEVSFPARRSS